jgi:hypothetical protein
MKLVLHHLLTGKPECIKRFNLNAPLVTIWRRDVKHNVPHKPRKWYPLQNRTLSNAVFLLVLDLVQSGFYMN